MNKLFRTQKKLAYFCTLSHYIHQDFPCQGFFQNFSKNTKGCAEISAAAFSYIFPKQS